MPEVKDYYKILGVKEDATQEEIKKAYRKLARKHHPDKNQGDKKAEERFKEIQEANDVIGNTEKRKEYDLRRKSPFGFGDGHDTAAGGRFYRAPDGTYVRYESQGGGAGPDEFGGFGDVFERIFGGRAAPGGQQQYSRPQRGRDLETTVSLSFQQALEGGKTEVVLPSNERVRIDIPKGVSSGFKIRIRDRGEKGSGGRGDLFVTFQVAGHPRFTRRGNNLYVVEHVNLFEAVAGTKRNIENAYGKQIKLTIPAGIQPGEKLRLREQGIESGKGKGDLFVEIQVDVPKDLSEDDRKAVEELGRKLGLL